MTIDVSDILTDPDLTMSFDVIRSVQTVVDGFTTESPTTIKNVIGSVQSGSGQTLVLLDDGSRISDSLSVTTQFQLYASTAGRSADIIVYRGAQYVVKVASNWSGWGGGFCNVLCEFTGMNP